VQRVADGRGYERGAEDPLVGAAEDDLRRAVGAGPQQERPPLQDRPQGVGGDGASAGNGRVVLKSPSNQTSASRGPNPTVTGRPSGPSVPGSACREVSRSIDAPAGPGTDCTEPGSTSRLCSV
jgi:hypothetical protein